MKAFEPAEGSAVNAEFPHHRIRKITDRIFYIIDYLEQSFYVLVGENTTAVIDTGMVEGEKILPLVKRLADNDNPIILLLTHSHYDHAYHMDEFEKVYLCRDELSICKGFYSNNKDNFQRTIHMGTGTTFDLGGETLEIFQVAGHTPGSTVVYARNADLLFTGDAIGSGYGPSMFTKGLSESLTNYCKNLLDLQKWLVERGGRMKFWGGHQLQQFQSKHVPVYNPVNMGYLGDLIDLVDMVAKGEIVGQESDFPHVLCYEPMKYAFYGRAELTYMQSNL